MIEFTREKYNYDPVSFTLVDNHDHVTHVPGATLLSYYVSISGNKFNTGVGQIRESGHGLYDLFIAGNESSVGPTLIYIPGSGSGQTPAHDPVRMRINCTWSPEVFKASQIDLYLMTFIMTSSGDHVTPLPGLSPTLTLSKDGSAFENLNAKVVEIGNDPGGKPGFGFGFYKVMIPVNIEDIPEFNTECVYLIKAVAPGADITYDAFQVLRYNYPA